MGIAAIFFNAYWSYFATPIWTGLLVSKIVDPNMLSLWIRCLCFLFAFVYHVGILTGYNFTPIVPHCASVQFMWYFVFLFSLSDLRLNWFSWNLCCINTEAGKGIYVCNTDSSYEYCCGHRHAIFYVGILAPEYVASLSVLKTGLVITRATCCSCFFFIKTWRQR